MPEPTPSRILILDDEVPQTDALCITLRDHGYETVGVTSGAAALAALADSRFELLLTDLMLPDMDGVALIRRALSMDSDLVTVMMTGHGTIATAVAAMQSGAFDYILKPFKVSAILPIIARALAVRKLRLENKELRARVTARTAQLEAANQELEAFSFSVSHDLRAPLRALTGFAQILQSECHDLLPPESQQHLEIISTSATRMTGLINGLLQFSRTSRQIPLKRHISMDTLVRESLLELHMTQRNPKVDVVVELLPDCEGDPVLINQVFFNLLSNAFKFTRKSAHPRIEVGAQHSAGECVYFVRDNGVGFDSRHAQNLFGIFQRLHSENDFEGTGVGLSLVQRIIQRHGGRVWAEAEVGKGATFFFTLPQANVLHNVGV